MTGEQLREEMARIAEGAPEVSVPDDLFARGRRATTRTRVLVAAAAVACVGLIAVVTVPLVTSNDAPVADGEQLAIPDHIYAPPAHVTDLEDDLAVGPAAAAFLTDAGIPVVVDADDGDYHLLDLADISTRAGTGFGILGRQIALSPDGSELAWSWAGEAVGDWRPSGVRVVDLETGQVRETVIGQRSVLVYQLAWSPNGRQLAWLGQEARVWTDQTYEPRADTVAGVISGSMNGATTRAVVAGGNATTITARGTTASYGGDTSAAVAVSDDGRLAAVVGWSLYVDGERSRLAEDPSRRVGGIWFDGRRVLGVLYDTRNGKSPSVRVLPKGQSAPTSTQIPEPGVLGIIGPDQALLYDDTALDSDSPSPTVEIVTWGPGSDATAIIGVDEGAMRLTLAYQLIDPDHPTVTRPEPDWPWSTEHKLSVFIGGALLVVLFGCGGWLLVRRPQLKSSGGSD